MNNEENTKEKSVEELAEVLAEAIDEGVSEQEEKAVEINLEDAVVEENSAEEAPVEESAVEEVPVEEAPVEEPAAEEPKKKSKKGLIITLSIVGVLLIGIAAAYLGISSYNKDKFVMGTNVNGVDCSEKTLAQVEAMLQKQVEEYALTIQ